MPISTIMTEIDRLMAPWDRTDSPGLAIGISVDGVPVFRRGYGLASVESGVALSPSIRMRIGSISKHFTCLAVLLLEERGLLSLDDSPRKHIAELPEWAAGITLRQLMSHTGGLRCSTDLFLQFGGLLRPADADLGLSLLMRQDSVNFAPGTDWSYNNGGYVLLSEIVARVSGRRFADFLRQEIFVPVGMHDTLLRPVDTDLVHNSASLHVPMPDGSFMRGIFGIPIQGEGGIVSTIDDMLRWTAHMDAPKIGSEASWAEMRTPLTTHGYGLGLYIEHYRGGRVVHHAGGVIGGASQMIKVVDHGLDIVIITNCAGLIDPVQLAKQIIDLCVADLLPEPEDVRGPAITGVFHSAETGQVLELNEADGAQVLTTPAGPLPLIRDGAGRLFLRPRASTDLQLFPRKADGKVGEIDAIEFGRRRTFKRVDAAGTPSVETVLGRFECEAAMTAAEVTASTSGSPSVRFRSSWGEIFYNLKPLGPDLWLVQSTVPGLPLGGTIEVDADGFRFTTARTHRLRFNRLDSSPTS